MIFSGAEPTRCVGNVGGPELRKSLVTGLGLSAAAAVVVIGTRYSADADDCNISPLGFTPNDDPLSERTGADSNRGDGTRMTTRGEEAMRCGIRKSPPSVEIADVSEGFDAGGAGGEGGGSLRVGINCGRYKYACVGDGDGTGSGTAVAVAESTLKRRWCTDCTGSGAGARGAGGEGCTVCDCSGEEGRTIAGAGGRGCCVADTVRTDVVVVVVVRCGSDKALNVAIPRGVISTTVEPAADGFSVAE